MRKVTVRCNLHVSINEDIVVQRYMDGRNKVAANNKVKATDLHIIASFASG